MILHIKFVTFWDQSTGDVRCVCEMLIRALFLQQIYCKTCLTIILLKFAEKMRQGNKSIFVIPAVVFEQRRYFAPILSYIFWKVCGWKGNCILLFERCFFSLFNEILLYQIVIVYYIFRYHISSTSFRFGMTRVRVKAWQRTGCFFLKMSLNDEIRFVKMISSICFHWTTFYNFTGPSVRRIDVFSCSRTNASHCN